MLDALWLTAALIAGALVAWTISRRSHTLNALAKTREAEVRLEEARAQLERERASYAEDRSRDEERFKAISSDVMRQSNEDFLKLATTKLESATKQAEGDLALKQEAIDAQLKPVKETLEKYQEGLAQLEVARQSAYAGLVTQIGEMGKTQTALQKETTTLSTALRNPTVRGRWGEMTLARVVELAGLSEHVIETQTSVNGDERRLRPDMLVRLPGGRVIVVDAKAPLDAYLDAVKATTDEDRDAALARHAKQMRAHVLALSARSYSDHFDTPSFVVMFIPGDAFLSAALEADAALLDEALERNVVLATPGTLVSLLRTIEMGWRQEKMAQNAKVVSDLGRLLHDRLAGLTGSFDKMGRALGHAVDSYNTAMGSYESRVIVPARKLRELGCAAGTDLAGLKMVEKAPRPVAVIEPNSS